MTAATPPRLHAPRSRGEPLRSLIAGRIVLVVTVLAAVSATCGSVALASSTGTLSAPAGDGSEQGEPFGEAFQELPGEAPMAGEARSALPAAYRGVATHTFALTADPAAPAGLLANGELWPVVVLRPHEAQLWRLIDAAPDRSYQLRLPGYRFTVVRQDGVQKSGAGTVDALTLAPGTRYDVVVTATEPMSTTWLRAVPTGDAVKGDEKTDNRLVRVDVAEPAADHRLVLTGQSRGG